MCECIQQIEKSFLEQAGDKLDFKKPIKGAKLGGTTFLLSDNALTTATYNNMEVELEGRKSKVKTPIFHTFCPYCGERYKKEESA